MKGHVNTKNGEISIENQVIAKYAGICALGCFGIVGMAMVNMKDGIAKLLTRDNIRKGVFVSVKNNKITIDFHIIVSYGVSISTVASNLMESVKYRVEEFTSLEVERIKRKFNYFAETDRIAFASVKLRLFFWYDHDQRNCF